MGRIVFIVAGMLILCGFIAWFHGNTPPHISVPTPAAPPGPNAFDDLARAAALEQDRNAIDTSFTQPEMLKPDLSNGITGLSSAQIDQYSTENQLAVATVRHGFAHTYFSQPIRSSTQLLPYLSADRGLARLLSFDARAAAAHGDWSETLQDSIDSMQIGAQVEQHGVLIDKLVGIACRAIGRATAWYSVDRVDARHAASAARRIEQIDAASEPFQTTLHEEEYSEQSVLQEILTSPNPLANVGAALSGSPSTTSSVGPALASLFFMVYPKEAIVRNNVDYMKESVRRAGMPWQVSAKLPPQSMPHDPINSILLPIFDKGGFKATFDNTMNRLLMTSLALRAYNMDHGSYPNSLTQLVPQYLGAVPNDPFSGSGSFRYKLVRPSQYLLYSIGPDGIDDGGKPFLHKEGATVTKRWMDQTDKGDIVAGVNRG